MSDEPKAEETTKPVVPKIPVTIMLQLANLKAINLLASSDGTRHVLCGVLVEVNGRNVRLVATDGRKLGVLNLPGAVVCDEAEAAMVADVVTSFVISSELVEMACRAFRGKNVSVTIERDEKDGLRIVTLDGKVLTGAAIDGTFPKWTQVLPTAPPVAAANLDCNIDFINEFHAVSRLLCKEPSMYLRGHTSKSEGVTYHSFSVRFPNPDFFGVFMPLRVAGESFNGTLPAWLPKAA